MAIDITWKKYEKDLKTGNVETQRAATDAFLAERDLQTQTSKSAREWETARKQELAKNKPIAARERLEKKDKEINKSWNQLFKAGTFDSDLKPAPGYILIGTEQQESQTESGIIITNEVTEPNEGIVLEVGSKLIWDRTETECPCKVGDKILFKRGAGLSMMIKDHQCKLIYFPDILGIFNA